MRNIGNLFLNNVVVIEKPEVRNKLLRAETLEKHAWQNVAEFAF